MYIGHQKLLEKNMETTVKGSIFTIRDSSGLCVAGPKPVDVTVSSTQL